MTYGEKAVGLSFNPLGDIDVAKIKKAYVDIIDLCDNLRTQSTTGERRRLFSIAITKAQTAQMWAVKAITWKE